MSITLFKTTFKNNWLLWVIFVGVLSMYSAVMLSMYDPENINALQETLKMLPEAVINSFNMSTSATPGVAAYLANYLYGMLMFGFPLVYIVLLANKLVAKQVDNGSFAYLLSTPNSRVKIVVTQALYAVISLIVMFAFIFALGILMSGAMFPKDMDIWQFFRLNLLTLCLQIAIFAISFFFSCLFNDAKKSIAFGAGIPVALLLLNMLGSATEELSAIRKISPYGWYDPGDIVSGGDMWGYIVVYLVMAALLLAGGIVIFKRKRLPL